MTGKSRGNPKQEQSSPELRPGSDTTKLQPLSPSAAVHHKKELQLLIPANIHKFHLESQRILFQCKKKIQERRDR